jgi:hypothetical protein
VRHDRRANDADGQVEHLRVGHDLRARNEAGQHRGERRVQPQQLGAEANADQGHQRDDDCLQRAKPSTLQRKNQHHIDHGDAYAHHQWQAKQQVQADGHAQHLGQVAGHNGNLAKEPEHQVDARRKLFAAGLGQVAPAGQTQPHCSCLEQHRHQVGRKDHRQQRIAKLRSARNRGGPVAGVHVPDRHQITGPGKGQHAPCVGRAAGAARHRNAAVNLGQAGDA